MTATRLTISVKDGHIIDWMDKDLPTPHTSEYDVSSNPVWNRLYPNAYKISYIISGYFGKARSKTFLHDIAERITYALGGDYEIEQFEVLPGTATIKLNRFLHLDRVPTYNQELEANAFNGSRHEIFDCLRYKAYEMKRNGSLNLEALTVYGNRVSNGSEHIKHLAKNVYEWTQNNYTPRPKPTMSRTEASKVATAFREERTKRRVFASLKYKMTFFDDISISTLAKSFKISRTSFYKYEKIMTQVAKASQLLNRPLTPYGTVMNSFMESLKKVFFFGDEVQKNIQSLIIDEGRQREAIHLYTG